jgi:hypothetical protein
MCVADEPPLSGSLTYERRKREPVRVGFAATAGHTRAMGVRTRGLDIAIGAKRQVANAAARAEAQAVIERWNEQLAVSRDILWSPTIRAALIAGTPWLDVFRCRLLRPAARRQL